MSEIKPEERELLAKCCAAHGSGCVATRASDGTFVVIRPCTLDERGRWHKSASRKDDKGISDHAIANAQLSKSVVVCPDGDAKIALFERLPYLCDTVANKAVKISGGELEDLGND